MERSSSNPDDAICALAINRSRGVQVPAEKTPGLFDDATLFHDFPEDDEFLHVLGAFTQ